MKQKVMKQTASGLLLALAFLVAGAAGAGEASTTSAIGSEGEIYRLLTGRYSELFPGNDEAAAESRVLALEIQKTGELPRRLLVPGTSGPDREDRPSLVADATSENLFLVWETQFNTIHPLLSLVVFNGETWSDTFDLIYNPYTPKRSPRLLVSHQTSSPPVAGETPSERLLVHLVWSEEPSPGLYESYYTALTLEDGEFLGNSPVYRLDDFVAPLAAGDSAPAVDIGGHIEIQQGRDSRTALIVFQSNRGQGLITLELDLLPIELVRLADGARAQIIDLGSQTEAHDIELLASSARDVVLANGGAFHPEIVRAIAEEARAQIIDLGARDPRPDLRSVADHARAQIIDLGAKLSGRGLRNVHAGSSQFVGPATEIDLATASEEDSSGGQVAKVRTIAARAPAEISSSLQVFLHSSQDGSDAVMAWRDGDVLRYVESQGDGWTPPRTLALTPSFDWVEATELLRQRVRYR